MAAAPADRPTTLVLVRHGVTEHTSARRFSGGLGGDNPPLSEEGRDQAAQAARWLTELGDRVDAVLTSPVRRTRETAALIGAELGLAVTEEPAFAEMDFGRWDGRSFAEVAAEDRAGMDAWFADLAAAPHGGESFHDVRERVLGGLERVLIEHAGQTVVVASHVTPIKTLVAHALGAPLEALFALELAPASVSVVAYYPDETAPDGRRPSLRSFNGLAPGRRTLLDTGRW
ncbi:histidine phosphatase family protein [Nocardioides sp. GY 10113]|uniref:histidine phosphatase family protein n=1 Tax=Nocardioides sp. GY 10113 TaxID=2569761 RepID=UPI0010A8C699|nr:histidine phosphatase family protein [Nocardioides sp. GY 10113]TIC83822.1 histidine phosphatase family protein [Nocardioides sp. GY 10113]